MPTPRTGFNFELVLGNVQVASFAECSGLSMEVKVTTYQEGGRNEAELVFPETGRFGNVTLKRGLTGSNELISWQMDVAAGFFSVNPRGTAGQAARNIAILLKDEAQNTVKRWELIRALPVKWIGPDLKAAASELAIEALELAHEGIVVVSQSSSAGAGG